MCARFTVDRTPSQLAVAMGLRLHEPVTYQGVQAVAFPTQQGLIAIGDELISAQWSLHPKNNLDMEFSKRYATHNAKVETLSQSRLYRGPWEHGQRCVIPVTSFTEWRGEKGRKERLELRIPGQDLTFIAGLWEQSYKDSKTFTMLTCEPNDFMKPIHHRMPVILSDWRAWLSQISATEAIAMCGPWQGQLEIA